ncbi:glycolipid transfer protein domain-containing protein [Mycena amicta]|nr:glycolipid transfer protein domain-containing protein [Mycena amicta]
MLALRVLPPAFLGLVFSSLLSFALATPPPTSTNDPFKAIAVHVVKPPSPPICCLVQPASPEPPADILLSFEEWKEKRSSSGDGETIVLIQDGVGASSGNLNGGGSEKVVEGGDASSSTAVETPNPVVPPADDYAPSPHFRVPITDSFNYAGVDCSARVHTSHRTAKSSFADVDTTNGVNTLEFLEASQGLVGLFDLLGSAAFSVVQNDLKGNIVKPLCRNFVHAMMLRRREKKRTATEGLLWLLRGLSFTCKALQNAQANKKEELSAAFTKSYENTLKKFHNFVVKGIFSVVMKACPYRADFYAKLAADPAGGEPASDEKVNEELDKWLAALDAIVAHMEGFYEKGGYGKGF